MLQHQGCSLMLWVVVTPGVLGQQPWLPVPVPGTCRALCPVWDRSTSTMLGVKSCQMRAKFVFVSTCFFPAVPVLPWNPVHCCASGSWQGLQKEEKPLPPIPAAELTTSLPTDASSARFPCHLLC